MAAPVLTVTQLNDLVNTTLRNLGKPSFTEIATDLQRHTALRTLLRKNRRVLESGYAIQWDVMVAPNPSFKNVGIAATDNVAIVDVMTQATADWRFSSADYAVDGRELSMNREPSRIVNLFETRRRATMIGVAEGMEQNFWGPPVAITDTLTPWGINTWIVKNATEGFNGGAPSGYTTIGLNPTTYPRWNNYTAVYTTVTKDDFIRKARKAAQFTDWQPPVEGLPTFNTGDDYGFYTTYSLRSQLVESLEGQNENLGSDIAPMENGVMFLNTPVVWIPKLEADTTNPFYGVNWGEFKTYITEGWWLRETHVPIYPGQHTVSAHFLDFSYQWVTTNRRRHMVLASGTTYPS